MSATILLIGAGNMGYAMLAGWLAQDPSLRVHVVEPFADFRDRATTLGAVGVADIAELPEAIRPDLVVLAVKPQMVGPVLRACGRYQAATFVSVAAGITLAAMQAAIAAPIIRCMPNTPAAIGEGMMVLCAASDVAQPARELAERLMASSGAVAWLEDETLMDAVTAISGSGPAYVFHFIEALTQAGLVLGLPHDIAALLAKQTIAGAGRMALRSADTPTVLRQQVTSPNGTTAAALAVLMGHNALIDLVVTAAAAARDRGVALGKEA